MRGKSRDIPASVLRDLVARGATIRGINLRVTLPDKAPPESVIAPETFDREEQRLIVGVVIEGRAVPWSVPKKTHKKSPKLIAWQAKIKAAVREKMGNEEPYGEMCEIRGLFLLKRYGNMPDDLNLMKSTEDALQEYAITNDKMSRFKRIAYNPDAKINMTMIEVWTVGRGIFDGY